MQKSTPCSKLRIDFVRRLVLRTDMEDRDGIIDRLLTLAGSIMEDAVPVALSSRLAPDAAQRIAVVLEAGKAIVKLAAAANVVLNQTRADAP